MTSARTGRLWLLVLCGACADTPAESTTDSAVQSEPPEPPSYRAVREIFTRSCAYNRCHTGVPTGAALPLPPGGDPASVLVGVASCEYPPMQRVKAGDPEHSWLMIKLTAEVRPKDDPLADYVSFEPETGWDDTQRGCRDRAPDGTPLFGQRMPLTAPNLLPDEELALIREWIREGAPH